MWASAFSEFVAIGPLHPVSPPPSPSAARPPVGAVFGRAAVVDLVATILLLDLLPPHHFPRTVLWTSLPAPFVFVVCIAGGHAMAALSSGEEQLTDEDELTDDGLSGDDGPVFHAPVSFSVPGKSSNVRAVMERLLRSKQPRLGEVVHAYAAGSLGVAAHPGWRAPAADEFLGHPSGGHDTERVTVDQDARRPARPTTAARPRRPHVAVDAEDAVGDAGDAGDDESARFPSPPEAVVPPLSDRARPSRAHAPAYSMAVALTASVRRACGLPSSTPVGQVASPFRATVVGDPSSRSRAIALRFGSMKRDAILWVSNRGGLMCSCFHGTQHALFLSVGSRSADCWHTTLLRKSVSDSGVAFSKFVKRMHLADAPPDFAVHSEYGASVVWTVLYQSVFSLVSFSAGNVATCVAPGCRRFRNRCGHVKLARPLQAAHKSSANVTSGQAGATASKTSAAGMEVPHFLVSTEEDEGIEKMPPNTARAKTDADEAEVANRVSRNLLPCSGEVADGAVWARTADLHGLCSSRAASGDEEEPGNVRQMRQLFDAFSLLGHVRDPAKVLVDAQCSCGQRREQRQEVLREPALLYTHHPTAPALPVSFTASTFFPSFWLCTVYVLRSFVSLFHACHTSRSNTSVSFLSSWRLTAGC